MHGCSSASCCNAVSPAAQNGLAMVVTEKFTALVMQTRCKGLQMLGDCGCFGSPACNQAAAKNETQNLLVGISDSFELWVISTNEFNCCVMRCELVHAFVGTHIIAHHMCFRSVGQTAWSLSKKQSCEIQCLSDVPENAELSALNNLKNLINDSEFSVSTLNDTVSQARLTE